MPRIDTAAIPARKVSGNPLPFDAPGAARTRLAEIACFACEPAPRIDQVRVPNIAQTIIAYALV